MSRARFLRGLREFTRSWVAESTYGPRCRAKRVWGREICRKFACLIPNLPKRNSLCFKRKYVAEPSGGGGGTMCCMTTVAFALLLGCPTCGARRRMAAAAAATTTVAASTSAAAAASAVVALSRINNGATTCAAKQHLQPLIVLRHQALRARGCLKLQWQCYQAWRVQGAHIPGNLGR